MLVGVTVPFRLHNMVCFIKELPTLCICIHAFLAGAGLGSAKRCMAADRKTHSTGYKLRIGDTHCSLAALILQPFPWAAAFC